MSGDVKSWVRQCQDTHKESDLPALHSVHLENDVLGLVIRQGYAAADLVIAHRKNGPTARFRVVAGTRIQLHVSIMLYLLGQLQKLLQKRVWEVGGNKRPFDENLTSEATAILAGHMVLSYSECTFFFWTMKEDNVPCALWQ